ncbi:hypothetical protein [Roseateles sp.]|uniref:hypothetical protein n=1 Tax=Roseateles sp. TaxID=1971397 RepID=UPI0025FA08C4|nr:hypothetical protein [Roseateles sp.]MBV8036474.1 hypothetical protein [Roseateles sp.]
MTSEAIVQMFFNHQWWFHGTCILAIAGVRWAKIRSFFGLLLASAVLLSVAFGNAMIVEILLTNDDLPFRTTMGLKAIALVSSVVYGAVAASFIAFGATYDKPKEA